MKLGFQIAGVVLVAGVAALVIYAQKHREAAIGFVVRWGAPIMMTLAYTTLAITSDVDNTGKAWMTIGLAFVLVVWWILQLLTGRAALSRAIGIGDADRILELAGRQVLRRRGEFARAPYRVACAFAYEIRGDWRNVITALDAVDPAALARPEHARLRLLATATRVAALVELGELANARAILTPSQPASAGAAASSDQLHAVLAEGRVLATEGSHDEAERLLVRITDNIRATSIQRATAFHYRARLADARGDAATATKHRSQVTRFAPGSWMTHEPAAPTAQAG